MSARARAHPDNPERWGTPDLSGDERCPLCGHIRLAHSRDAGLGCAHHDDELGRYCGCTHYSIAEGPA